MKKIVLTLFLAFILAHPVFAAAPATGNWIIVPDTSIGPVPWSGSEKDFVKAYGNEAVRGIVESDRGARGDVEEGLVLFPNDPDRRLEIAWQDQSSHSGVRYIGLYQVNMGKPNPGQWQLSDGVRLGHSLQDLQTLNGQPFALLLTGISGSSVVKSWNGGRLADLSSGKAHIHFGKNDKNLPPGEYGSDNPVLQNGDIWVSDIRVW